ncbi:MAG TPA: TRAP transporter small permease [Alphaproteobacteria bacterium]|nr:TRAP transporter small permease [Alphaproteobacteria bacterium]
MRLLAAICRAALGVAALALAGIALVTVADIVMGNVFRRPIIGAYEMVETGMAFVVFLGVPEIFRTARNITVDLVDHFLGDRAIGAFRFVGALASVVFAAIMAYAMLGPASDAARYGDVKADTGIPVVVLWAPVLIGMALAIVGSLFRLVRRGSEADRT